MPKPPEEIAVSIMAELIRERSKRPAPANLVDIAAAIQTKSHFETWAMVTIVQAKGSTPRGVGARMLINPKGANIGTIGGGPLEKEAEQIALDTINSKNTHLVEFKLGSTLAANQGMICGGSCTFFVQPI